MDMLPRRPRASHADASVVATWAARDGASLHRRAPSALLATLLSLLLLLVMLPAAPGGATEDPDDDRVPGQLLVRFHEDAPPAAAARARRDADAREVATIDRIGVHVWRVPEQAAERALAGLQRNPHVDFAEFDAVVEAEGEVVPNDTWFPSQWGLTKVNGPTAWATTTGVSSTTIAIVDTGVTEVGDLTGKVLRGYNAIDGSTDTIDNHGHGTRSASVAGAATDNGAGIAAYCWDCMILPVKVMDTGSGTMSDLARGITWAADNGADVISMSLSGSTGTNAVATAVSHAASTGAVLVAAAGNQGDTTPRYPAAYADVISVAGTDSNDALYSWSNHGSWVDVSAPGVNHSIGRDGSVGTYAGTSSATPAVAGVLGLGISQGASATEVRDALQVSAAPLSAVRYGRVDAAAMLDLIAPAPVPTPEPAPEPAPEPIEEPAPEPSDDPVAEPPPSEPEPEPLTLSLAPFATAAGGPNWTANVTITGLAYGEPSAGVTVTGAWSAGASGSVTCTTGSDGTCTVTRTNIHNRDKSVTYTLTALDGAPQAGPSTTVTR